MTLGCKQYLTYDFNPFKRFSASLIKGIISTEFVPKLCLFNAFQ